MQFNLKIHHYREAHILSTRTQKYNNEYENKIHIKSLRQRKACPGEEN